MNQFPNSSIRIEKLTNSDQFDQIHDAWSRLYAMSPSSKLFNSWYWNRLWWNNFSYLGELHIILVYVNDVVEAIAPFYQCKTRALRITHPDTIRFIGFGGSTSPDDLDVIANPSVGPIAIEAIVDYLLCLKPLNRLQLSDLPEHSVFLKTLLSQAAKKEDWQKPFLQYQYRRVQSLPNSISAFEKNLSRNSRKQRKRRRHKLEQAGKFKFNRCESPEEIDQAFSKLVALHETRHASKGEVGSFGCDRYRKFHLELMKAALLRDELRLITLELDEKIISIEYSFYCKGTIMFFQNGFDPEYDSLSPGHLSMMYIIDEAILEGAQAMDLLKGDYEYKSSYAKDTMRTVDVDAWRCPIMSFSVGAARSLSGLWQKTVRKLATT